MQTAVLNISKSQNGAQVLATLVPTRSFRLASCVATSSDGLSASDELPLSELAVDRLLTPSPFPFSGR